MLLHARIVLPNVASVAPAVNKPEPLLTAPPLATTDHVTGVTEMTAPVTSVPTATNCWVPLGGTVAGSGVTAMASN